VVIVGSPLQVGGACHCRRAGPDAPGVVSSRPIKRLAARVRLVVAGCIVDRYIADVREPTYLILLALSDGPLHGYAIVAEVSEISAGRTRLGPGTLYTALDRLAHDGLVSVSGEEVVDGRHRRYYELTDSGTTALSDETQRLSALARAARGRLRHATAAAT
jgi:PadR family transcriptional regulator, regulatory protein PadR